MWLAIGEKDRKPQITYPRVRIVRFSGASREYGIEKQKLEGVTISVYSAAKTVADRFAEISRELSVDEVEDDGLVLVVDSVSATKVKEDEEYECIRLKFDALLGSARIPVQVDLGFGDTITPRSQLIVFPTVLELPAPQLESYPRETVVAEKFQAMVMLGIANSGSTRTARPRCAGLCWDFGFLWSDLFGYSVGVMIGVIDESAIVTRMKFF